ncbi:unnamed protein product [Aspergillus oryzae]|uniref:Unnamed protein product n=1 Tax=Aspergillus oryzae TaxID=5062 RepID=A0AAN4YVA4_ASPOZ|nr:unnamed protein product [Aspergillus oryzae]
MESPSDITALTEFDKILSNLLQFLEKNKTVPKAKLQSRISILPSTQKTLLISFFSSRNSEENTKSAATIQPKNGNNVESPPQIVITDTLKNTFKEWKNKTETYFEEGSKVSKEYHWGLAIGRLEQRESEVEVNRIKSRFEKLNMFRSAVDHNYHTGNKWYKDGSSLLVEVIQRQYPSVDEKNKIDAKRLEAAIQEGRNYDMWAEFLGDDGYLAALPLDVHESKYVYLPFYYANTDTLQRIVDDYDLVNLGTIVSKRLQEQLQVDDYFDVKEGRKRTKTSPGKPSMAYSGLLRLILTIFVENKSHKSKRRRVDTARTTSVNHRSPTANAGANTERLAENTSVHESQHTRANSSENVIEINQRTELNHLSRSTQNWHFLEGSPLRAIAESTTFPSMDRDPDHNVSLHSPESQSNTNTDSYPDQSVHISQESTENLNSTAQVTETLLPYLFPQYVPPSPVDTMSPSNHPQFVPPTSIDTTIFSSYPQFAPLDMMMFSNYPQFIPEPPQESEMGNLFNN